MKRYALYPETQYGSARLRAFMDFTQVQFGPLPYWSAVCSRSDFPARAKSKPVRQQLTVNAGYSKSPYGDFCEPGGEPLTLL